MKKQFFREFAAVRDLLREDQKVSNFKRYSEQNYRCLEALKNYLYSYRWCRKERERILLQEADSKMRPIDVAANYEISYDTYRSMSSRVSRRLYQEVGADFVDVILGENIKAQDWLIETCVVRTEDYNINMIYPDFLLSSLRMIAADDSVELDSNIKIDKTKALIFQFLADNTTEAILSRLSLLDRDAVIQCYKILTEKKYFDLRIKVLAYMNTFNNQNTLTQMEDSMYMSLGKKVLISKKEYEEFLRYKKDKASNL